MKDLLQVYLIQIEKYPLLTYEQCKKLFIKKEEGNERARDKIISSNLRLVIKLAKTVFERNLNSKKDFALLDLIQEGNTGLIRAVDKYDYRKNVPFASYASWHIKSKIQQYMLLRLRQIYIPKNKKEEFIEIAKRFSCNLSEVSRDMFIKEGFTDKQFNYFLAALEASRTTSGIDVNKDVYECDVEDSTKNAYDKAITNELHDMLEAALLTFTDKQREVFMKKWIENKSAEEIGVDLGVCRGRIYQIMEKIKNKLKANKTLRKAVKGI